MRNSLDCWYIYVANLIFFNNFGIGRFPQAPGPAWLKDSEEPASAKAKNNPKDGREIFYWAPDAEVYNYQALAKKRMEEFRKPEKLSKDGK